MNTRVPYLARATQVHHGLWIAPAPSLDDFAEMISMGISMVIDCTRSGASRGLDDLGFAQRLHCPMDDQIETQSVATENAMQTCMASGASRLKRNGSVLVHCRAGIYRSPSIAYGILRLSGISMLDAVRIVARRPMAIPRYIENVERAVMRAAPPSAWNP